VALPVEIWRMPADRFGSFVAGIPAPLGIGKVELADGRWVCGFICEPVGLDGAEDITGYGGWRGYMEQQ
ncbi:MAG TPA: allophanate hydrolase, partial [Marinobacter sp.]|nr:allophanate hydrolase [Marinobacter sp.]